MDKRPSSLAEQGERPDEEDEDSPFIVESMEELAPARKDFNLARDGFDDSNGYGAWNLEQQALIDQWALKGLFTSEDWVFIMVDLIAGKISSLPLRVMKWTIVDGKKVAVPDQGHKVQAMIDMPNEHSDYHAWMYAIAADESLGGNALVWVASAARQLYHIPFEVVRMELDQRKNVVTYDTYGWEEGVLVKMLSIQPKEIVHIRRPNPSSMLWGLSPFVPVRRDILFNRYTSEFMLNYYEKGATPGMVITLPDGGNEKKALRLVRSFEMAYTGRRNQRRTLVLSRGMKADTIQHKLAEQELAEHIKLNRQPILAALKVPPHEVGLAESGSLGSDEHRVALQNFWDATLLPACRRIEGALTRGMKNLLGDRFLAFDTSAVAALQEDEIKKAEKAEKLLKTHTLNEVRAKVYNAPPLPDGDKTPGAQAAAGPFAFAADPQRTLDVTPKPAALPPPEPVADKEAEVRERRIVSLAATDPGWWQKRNAKIDAHETAKVADMHALTMGLFVNVAVAVTSSVKNYGVKKPKATKEDQSAIRKRIAAALKRLEGDWVKGATDALVGSVDFGYGIQLDVPFGVPNETELQAVRERNAKGRRQILEARQIRTFQHMSTTTTERVMAAVEAGIAEGKTVQDIAKDIAGQFRDADAMAGRAMTIARTETLTAVSIGQAASMKDAAGTLDGELVKMWVNSGDLRVRGNPGGEYPDSEADHWKLQGEVVEWDGKFSNGLEYPRDPSGGPAETINCRCSFIMVPKKDASRLDEDLNT